MIYPPRVQAATADAVDGAADDDGVHVGRGAGDDGAQEHEHLVGQEQRLQRHEARQAAEEQHHGGRQRAVADGHPGQQLDVAEGLVDGRLDVGDVADVVAWRAEPRAPVQQLLLCTYSVHTEHSLGPLAEAGLFSPIKIMLSAKRTRMQGHFHAAMPSRGCLGCVVSPSASSAVWLLGAVVAAADGFPSDGTSLTDGGDVAMAAAAGAAVVEVGVVKGAERVAAVLLQPTALPCLLAAAHSSCLTARKTTPRRGERGGDGRSQLPLYRSGSGAKATWDGRGVAAHQQGYLAEYGVCN